MRAFSLTTILLSIVAIALGLFTILVGTKPNSDSQYYLVSVSPFPPFSSLNPSLPF
jgi:hypothetical protein